MKAEMTLLIQNKIKLKVNIFDDASDLIHVS